MPVEIELRTINTILMRKVIQAILIFIFFSHEWKFCTADT